MDTLIQNKFIIEEIENENLIELKDLILSIDGNITIEKIYQKIFNKLGLNFYVGHDKKFYIEFKKYIEHLTEGSCKEQQILTNKKAVDKGKIIKLKDLEIKSQYIVEKITPNKRIIELSGLNTVNDSISRFGKTVPVVFSQWQRLCEIIVINLPLVIEGAVKKYVKQEFDKLYKIDEERQKEIKELNEFKENTKQDMLVLQTENKLLKDQLDNILELIKLKI